MPLTIMWHCNVLERNVGKHLRNLVSFAQVKIDFLSSKPSQLLLGSQHPQLLPFYLNVPVAALMLSDQNISFKNCVKGLTATFKFPRIR